ncbi:hypothetical protein [Natranaeroarchaeum sulfidigenes]|uniref:Uncharacterized protein n=1 Tax=Natranaeroarchaeum sulfidigenes TaxID=2784880 RepID=A0A897MQF4_9EURY|nr:hypothetical protein [Natranaeroarchaeum sulfidigenes]QSG02814.1 hypothetical protein AArcS_1603 [Natranaeroarchaeum sulfidigenes]
MQSDESADELTFEEHLQGMYYRYRQQHLEERLEELAQTMEETLLQRALTKAFFNESIDIDEDAKTAVQETVEKLEAGRYDEVDKELDSLAKTVEQSETQVTNQIQQLRIDRQDTISAMRRLNERVERVDQSQLSTLESLLNGWEWKSQVYIETNDTFEEHRQEAREYGNDMAAIFEDLKDQLFGAYDDTELRPLVRRLLDKDRLRLDELTEEERRQLAESDLADHVELKLS